MNQKRHGPHRANDGGRYMQAWGKLYGSNHSTTARRAHRLPPFGKRLAAVLADPASWPRYAGTSADGTQLTVTVLVGADPWAAAKEWAAEPRLFVVVPPSEDAAAFDWHMLLGHDPILIRPCGDIDLEALKRLVCALLRDGVQRALYIGERGMMRFLSVQEAARHD